MIIGVTEPATVRQILEHVGERTTAPAIAPARSPPLALNGQQLAAPEGVFEAIPELEFDQMLNLAAEAGHDQWRTSQVPLQSRSRNWSLIRPWSCKSAPCNGTSGGAWVSVVQALAECGERFGLPEPAHRICAISSCWAGQSFHKIE